ncbi:MAG: glucose-6-phosphate isomerase [Methylococcaceae bacterium]
MSTLRFSSAWQALEVHLENIKDLHMKTFFDNDTDRFKNFSLQFKDILFDFSKNRMTEETVKLLLDLAHERNVKDKIKAMFSGETINATENKSVLHVALRNRSSQPILVDGLDVMPGVNSVLSKMRAFTERVHSGEWKGYTGKAITDIVNVGIGGSGLGPKMACSALKPYGSKTLKVHFVSNIDQTDLLGTIETLSPETTLFLVASKSFTTLETMVNAKSARKWLLSSAKDESAVAKHFIAISTNTEKVAEFGIDTNNMFEFWNWVGGRFSLWSSIGLSIALYIGMDNFEQLLEGAYEADQHFVNTPFKENIPVMMALLGIWYNNFFQTSTHAIFPYDKSMRYFADYFQQGDMESNGKGVDNDGKIVDYQTGPIIWGQPGTNGQHAFFQLIHQGTKLVPCDFLTPANSQHGQSEHQSLLISNFLAQPEALMKGLTREEVINELNLAPPFNKQTDNLIAAKIFEGNKPSNSFLFKKLDPKTLGTLLAFYEHKIYVQGVIWNINSFDQMGVELGKKLANNILPELSNNREIDGHDSSTNGLINYYKKLRQV